MNEGNKRTIIIDCDTGTDDAIAIVAGLYAENANLVAITTVFGNTTIKNTSENTLNLTSYLGFDIPVAVGASAPLKSHVDERHAEDVHGVTGLGCVDLPKSEATLSENNAIETIYRNAVKAKGELEIIAIGPLTNIAMALLLYPQLKTLIKHIWVMGGAVYGGNITPTAEFNIWCDPEAARLVFASGVKCTMVGLDVTEKAILTEKQIQKIKDLNTKAGDVISDILYYMLDRHAAGGEDVIMHDALALGAALCPQCITCLEFFVDVECEGRYTFGHTAVDVDNDSGKAPNVSVAVELNLEVFTDWLYESIKLSDS